MFPSMEAESVFVTGANRGLGLEFVRQLVNLPTPPRLIFATYRNRDTVKALKDIRDASKKSQVILIKMDVTRCDEIEASRRIVEDMVGEKGLNLLINNAGAGDRLGFPQVTDDNILFHIHTNTLGPINVLKAMLPLLHRSSAGGSDAGCKLSVSSAAVVNISSKSASNSLLDLPPQTPEYLDSFGYKISKAALNLAMGLVAVKEKSVLIVQMCPGWVKTDMGGDRAAVEVTDSVAAMLQTMSKFDESHHGAFVDRHGNTIPF